MQTAERVDAERQRREAEELAAQEVMRRDRERKRSEAADAQARASRQRELAEAGRAVKSLERVVAALGELGSGALHRAAGGQRGALLLDSAQRVLGSARERLARLKTPD
jgi:hypothetical protein